MNVHSRYVDGRNHLWREAVTSHEIAHLVTLIPFKVTIDRPVFVDRPDWTEPDRVCERTYIEQQLQDLLWAFDKTWTVVGAKKHNSLIPSFNCYLYLLVRNGEMPRWFSANKYRAQLMKVIETP